ncbi:MAG: hypothetical protein IPM63_18370 [Acidobacteriota bacterium]|nr:MAG: hypothetical protein IPM63_18370 [Acidobacteriota bacterium]
MKKRLASCAIVLAVVGLCTVGIVAQNPPSRPDRPTQSDIVKDNLERRMNTMRNLDALARRQAEIERREELKTRYFRPELSDELRERMEVAPDVLQAYGDLLSRPDTGAIRLVPQGDCTRIERLSKATECYQENANIREYANAFSFREKLHTLFGRSDIGITSKYFVGGRHSVQTMIVDLGQMELSAVDRDSAEISFLFSFVPEASSKGMDAQFDDLKNGMTVASFENGAVGRTRNYSKVAKIEPGHVYAFRSIAYRGETTEPLEKDADVVVVFKVVDREEDGDTTIVWKVLSRKPGMVMKMSEEPAANGL